NKIAKRIYIYGSISTWFGSGISCRVTLFCFSMYASTCSYLSCSACWSERVSINRRERATRSSPGDIFACTAVRWRLYARFRRSWSHGECSWQSFALLSGATARDRRCDPHPDWFTPGRDIEDTVLVLAKENDLCSLSSKLSHITAHRRDLCDWLD